MAKKMKISLESKVKIKPDIVSRTVHKEEVLLDMNSGIYFGLNETGTQIWEHVKAGQSLTHASVALSKTYDLPAERANTEVLNLITQLYSKNLVEVR